MSKLLKGILVGLVIIGLSGCATKTDDIEVEAYTLESVNMDDYKTYQIIEGSGIVDDAEGKPMTNTANIDAQIHKILIAELESKGKAAVASNPDLYVAYMAGADTDVLKEKVDEEGDIQLENVSEAAMVLVMVDAKTEKIIWISAAIGEAKGLPVDQRTKRIEYAIKGMVNGI